MRTIKQATAHARNRALATGEVRFVIREDNEFHVASQDDAETFWYGTPETDIVFSTDDDD
jgi:hypothetical protein